MATRAGQDSTIHVVAELTAGSLIVQDFHRIQILSLNIRLQPNDGFKVMAVVLVTNLWRLDAPIDCRVASQPLKRPPRRPNRARTAPPSIAGSISPSLLSAL